MQTPQEEMQTLIQTCFESQDYATVYKCLNIYKNSFGCDEFYESCSILLLNCNGPKVTLISLDVSDAALETYLATETYQNLELIQFSGYDYITDLASILPTCDSEYFCFLEEHQRYDANRIASMLYHLKQSAQLDGIVCARNHIDDDGTIIFHPDYAYEETLGNKILTGQLLLEYSISGNINLYGNLSTLLTSTAYAKTLSFSTEQVTPDICSMALLYQLLLPAHIGYLYTPYVSTIPEAYKDVSATRAHYEAYIHFLKDIGKLSCQIPEKPAPLPSKEAHFPREITFITNQSDGCYYNLLPVIREAERRGFKVVLSDDRKVRSDICVYSQHICYPENARFSVILLHDMTQGDHYWPNFWEVERWNKFDIGILPGKTWADRWAHCSCFPYAHPRHGVYTLGYPKSDEINGEALQERANAVREEFHLKYDYTIVYAPSWENDGKEDDFVKALSSLPVNLVIKHANWKLFPDILANTIEMRKLHEHKYDNVYYMDPTESIMTAIALCDLLVSDESNVMIDAILLNKPSIAVTDWLIPDETPSRPASVPVDFVIKCHKAELRQTAEAVMAHTIPYEDYVKKGWDTFSNVGSSCREIIDAIEYFTQGTITDPSPEFLTKQVTASRYAPCSMWN